MKVAKVGDTVITLVDCNGVPSGSVVEVTKVWYGGINCIFDGVFCDYFNEEWEHIMMYTPWSEWGGPAVPGEYDDTEEYTLPGGQVVYRGRNAVKPVEESGECWAYRYMGKDTLCQFSDLNISGNCKYGKYTATHLDGKLIKFTWEANE